MVIHSVWRKGSRTRLWSDAETPSPTGNWLDGGRGCSSGLASAIQGLGDAFRVAVGSEGDQCRIEAGEILRHPHIPGPARIAHRNARAEAAVLIDDGQELASAAIGGGLELDGLAHSWWGCWARWRLSEPAADRARLHSWKWAVAGLPPARAFSAACESPSNPHVAASGRAAAITADELSRNLPQLMPMPGLLKDEQLAPMAMAAAWCPTDRQPSNSQTRQRKPLSSPRVPKTADSSTRLRT